MSKGSRNRTKDHTKYREGYRLAFGHTEPQIESKQLQDKTGDSTPEEEKNPDKRFDDKEER